MSLALAAADRLNQEAVGRALRAGEGAGTRMNANEMTVQACLVAAALLLAAASPASADQVASPGRTAGSDHPITAPRRLPASREARARPWTLEDALPAPSSALRDSRPDVAPKERPSLGRLPLQSGGGSFGLETENKVKPDHLPDGRPIPGLQPSAREPASYFGLSLSVPTNH
jgi:hypothetical protein